MREIIIDTETTGLSHKSGDRLVEIGCIELMNHIPTGRTYHTYINPERDMPAEAERVHGLSSAFLADKPVFAAVADAFLAFVDGAPLVAHNAPFDVGFINAELARLGLALHPVDRTIDTVELARRKFPGAQASLDALCRRFQIDTSHRTKHGALLDAELLAHVYLELVGGREPGLSFNLTAGTGQVTATITRTVVDARVPRPHGPSADEQAQHAIFIAKIKAAIWLRSPA